MKTRISFSLPPGPLRLGVIEADGVQVAPSTQPYLNRIREDIRPMLSEGYVYPDHLQKGIRSLLKAYGFHPSGRNRPASEFLVKDLQGRGSFKSINNIVDINNHLSLLSHLPISILDREKTGDHLCIRVGTENESYIFNQEGQDLSLKHLLIVARSDGDLAPFGSPVKDSHATKIATTTHNLVGFVYATPTTAPIEAMQQWLKLFADLLRSEGKASDVSWEILDGPQ